MKLQEELKSSQQPPPSIAGKALPADTPEAKQAESGIALQNLTTAPAKAKTYARHPVYDACAVMNRQERNVQIFWAFLIDQVAASLTAGPGQTGLSNFRFGPPWNMPNACEIYKSEDWGLSFTYSRLG